MSAPELEVAVGIYFDAKVRMFEGVPGFDLRQAGSLRCFHRHPHWPEQDAFYALNLEPHEVIEAVRAYRPHPQHMVTMFALDPAPLTPLYEALGYRRAGPGPGQPFLRLSLDSLPACRSDVLVQRVQSPADMRFINSVEDVMLPSHFHRDVFHYYFIEQDGRPVCTGRYVDAQWGAIYVAGMDTLPQYRRRGLATALMQRMHTDAAAAGAARSVLCSTALGWELYRKLGYEALAFMPSFVPREERGAA